MSEFKAEFYKTKDGSKPAREFILSQETKMKAKLFGLVDMLEQYGNQLREPIDFRIVLTYQLIRTILLSF